jgi:hypothetical protein
MYGVVRYFSRAFSAAPSFDSFIKIGPEVLKALGAGQGVVALVLLIFSTVTNSKGIDYYKSWNAVSNEQGMCFESRRNSEE